LEKELARLRAREITIEAFLRPDDISNDGWPRSAALASQPGVILRFVTKKGEMEFACDRFSDWVQNLRAIALGLEKLRQIDDYGIVVEEEQQYEGWFKKLPPASATDEAAECAKILIRYAFVPGVDTGKVLADRKVFDKVWREAVRRTHPDQNDGNGAADFNNVINARERLKALKGWYP
jgi:hypothetical protein